MSGRLVTKEEVDLILNLAAKGVDKSVIKQVTQRSNPTISRIINAGSYEEYRNTIEQIIDKQVQSSKEKIAATMGETDTIKASIRLPKSLWEKAKCNAEKENKTIEQYVANLLIEEKQSTSINGKLDEYLFNIEGNTNASLKVECDILKALKELKEMWK